LENHHPIGLRQGIQVIVVHVFVYGLPASRQLELRAELRLCRVPGEQVVLYTPQQHAPHRSAVPPVYQVVQTLYQAVGVGILHQIPETGLSRLMLFPWLSTLPQKVHHFLFVPASARFHGHFVYDDKTHFISTSALLSILTGD